MDLINEGFKPIIEIIVSLEGYCKEANKPLIEKIFEDTSIDQFRLDTHTFQDLLIFVKTRLI
jgi:hypothetical protein